MCGFDITSRSDLNLSTSYMLISKIPFFESQLMSVAPCLPQQVSVVYAATSRMCRLRGLQDLFKTLNNLSFRRNGRPFVAWDLHGDRHLQRMDH